MMEQKKESEQKDFLFASKGAWHGGKMTCIKMKMSSIREGALGRGAFCY